MSYKLVVAGAGDVDVSSAAVDRSGGGMGERAGGTEGEECGEKRDGAKQGIGRRDAGVGRLETGMHKPEFEGRNKTCI